MGDLFVLYLFLQSKLPDRAVVLDQKSLLEKIIDELIRTDDANSYITSEIVSSDKVKFAQRAR
ncbi:hypothetical protein E2C01_047184 [Portunus trituberculatus]|uniref:Uncharacterized protein n=1 Tax=Portunus trituberculatus TaxID=210409 RepID=A0A5B7G7A2_PORTR|nr:hypothetical protein [Portunus trituberculatus]